MKKNQFIILIAILIYITGCKNNEDQITFSVEPYYTLNSHIIFKLNTYNNLDSNINVIYPFSVKNKYLRKTNNDSGIKLNIIYENNDELCFNNTIKLPLMDDFEILLKPYEHIYDFINPLRLYHFNCDSSNIYKKKWKKGKYFLTGMYLKGDNDKCLKKNYYEMEKTEFEVYDEDYYIKKYLTKESTGYNTYYDSLTIIICPLRDSYDKRDITILVRLQNTSNSIIKIRSTYRNKLSIISFIDNLFFFEIKKDSVDLIRDNLVFGSDLSESDLLYSINPGESLYDIVKLNLIFKNPNGSMFKLDKEPPCWLWDKGFYSISLRYKFNDYEHFEKSWRGETISNKIQIFVE